MEEPLSDGNNGPQQMLQTVYMPKNLGLSETLLCNIITPSGKVRTVRALIDGGSQITALKRSVAKELKLRGNFQTLIVGTSGGQSVPLIRAKHPPPLISIPIKLPDC